MSWSSTKVDRNVCRSRDNCFEQEVGYSEISADVTFMQIWMNMAIQELY